MNFFAAVACVLVAHAVCEDPVWQGGFDQTFDDGKLYMKSEFTNVGTPTGTPAIEATVTNPWLRITLTAHGVSEPFNGLQRWLAIGLYGLLDAGAHGGKPSMVDVDHVLVTYDNEGNCAVDDAFIYKYLPRQDTMMNSINENYTCTNDVYVFRCDNNDAGTRTVAFYRRANTGDKCDTVLNVGAGMIQYAYGPMNGTVVSRSWYHGHNHSKSLTPFVFWGEAVHIDGQNATSGYNVMTSGKSPVKGQPDPTMSNPWVYFQATWNYSNTGADWLALSFLKAGTHSTTMDGADALTLWWDGTDCHAEDALLFTYGAPNKDSENATCSMNVWLAGCETTPMFRQISAWRQANTGDAMCDWDLTKGAAVQWAFGPVKKGQSWFTGSWYHHHHHANDHLATYQFKGA